MAKKEKRISLKETISNNIFMLKLIHKTAPFLTFAMIVFTVIQSIIGFLSNTFMLRYALNGINEGKPFEKLATTLLLFMFVSIALNTLTNWFYNCFYSIKMEDVNKKIRDQVYKKAVAVELGCYENPEYYDKFVKAIDECSSRAGNVLDSIANIIYFTINFSANFALTVFIDPIFILFSLIPLTVIPLRSKIKNINYEKDMKLKEENRRKDYSRRVFYLADYAKEMRLTDMPELMLKRFTESGRNVIKIIEKYGFKVAVLNYIIVECQEVLTTLGTTFYASWQTFVTGNIGYGDCIVIVNSINSISYTFSNSTNMLLAFQENALYIQNLREYLDYEPKIKDGNKQLPQKGDIVFENVSFKYDGAENYTLKNISLKFGENEKIAIVGHNGAGKTTLVKLIMRLYDAEGTIKYGGTEIKDLNVKEYRNIFSAVMQDFHVFALTAAENVLLRKRCPDDEQIIKEAIEKSGLEEKVETFEYGIDTPMTKEFDDKGEIMSGGEQQKLAISHVYSKKNRFVILDEPSSALDPIAEYEMYNNMIAACENCGMIFISHRLSSAVMADRIYLIENGEIAELGSHKELMEQNGRYAEMFRKQAQNYTEVEA